MSSARYVVAVDLSPEERTLLAGSLLDWGGPAHPTLAFARAMGFADIDDLVRTGRSIAEAIIQGQALTPRDWTRALLSAEVNFASTVVGAGGEWISKNGGSDDEWLDVLRGLSAKVPASVDHLG